VSWLSWIVVGAIAGLLARAVNRRGPHRPGCLGTILLGILGGLLGGVIFKAAGGGGINHFSLYAVLVAFVGAALLLFCWNAFSNRGS